MSNSQMEWCNDTCKWLMEAIIRLIIRFFFFLFINYDKENLKGKKKAEKENKNFPEEF